MEKIDYYKMYAHKIITLEEAIVYVNERLNNINLKGGFDDEINNIYNYYYNMLDSLRYQATFEYMELKGYDFDGTNYIKRSNIND